MVPFVPLLLAALPLCVTGTPAFEAHAPEGWREQLERHLKRPVALAPSCTGESLGFDWVRGQVLVEYVPGSKSRAVPDSVDTEGLALVLTGLIADRALPAGDVDLWRKPTSPPPPPAPTHPETPPPAASEPKATEAPHEHLWVYAGGGVGFATGLFASTFHVGAAGRFDHLALGLEMMQLGPFLPPSLSATPRLWLMSALAWYGADFGSYLRLDGGLALGAISRVSPWQPDQTSFVDGLAFSTRLVGRARVALLRWVDLNVRFEVGLPTALNGIPPPSAHAALQVGVEGRWFE